MSKSNREDIADLCAFTSWFTFAVCGVLLAKWAGIVGPGKEFEETNTAFSLFIVLAGGIFGGFVRSRVAGD